MWIIQLFISKIITTLFPVSCYGCHKEGASLCNSCLNNCKKSIDTPAIYIRSVYSFQDQLIKKTIHAIKYFHRRDLIEILTKPLTEKINEIIKDNKQKWILIPIPMPKMRKYIRGYNQAELMAKELGKKCSITVDTKILIRSNYAKRQVATKTKSERLKNQHNGFKIIGNVKNLNIILIDDVTTTGATITEARKILLQAGANDVQAVTIAH